MRTFPKLARVARWVLALAACVASVDASAAFSCSTVTVTAISTAYNPAAATNNDSAGTWTATCTRGATTDATTVTYQLGADNGANFNGTFRRVRLGATLYTYALYQDAGFTTQWQDGNNTQRIDVTFNFSGPVPQTVTVSGTFYVRIFGSQTAGAPGTYTDTVTVTLRNPPGANPTATLVVNAITSTFCTITVPPGNVSFSYTSKQGSAANASTNFGVRCTNTTPYTMALDATSGTLLGLNYTLALSQSSASGTGVTQTYSINGTIAAGQAGTCSTATCSGSQTRTLTVTY